MYIFVFASCEKNGGIMREGFSKLQGNQFFNDKHLAKEKNQIDQIVRQIEMIGKWLVGRQINGLKR